MLGSLPDAVCQTVQPKANRLPMNTGGKRCTRVNTTGQDLDVLADQKAERRKNSPYYTVGEVADILLVSTTTVYAALAGGYIPAIRVRGQWRIPKDLFDAWRAGEKPKNPGVVVPIHRTGRGRRRGQPA